MADTNKVTPKGDKIRKAVAWVADTLTQYPERTRKEVLREAETRFDLNPKECRFLEQEVPQA